MAIELNEQQRRMVEQQSGHSIAPLIPATASRTSSCVGVYVDYTEERATPPWVPEEMEIALYAFEDLDEPSPPAAS